MKPYARLLNENKNHPNVVYFVSRPILNIMELFSAPDIFDQS